MTKNLENVKPRGPTPFRDPIGEYGGINLYGFVSNCSINNIDILGDKIYIELTRHVAGRLALYGELKVWTDDSRFSSCGLTKVPKIYKTIENLPSVNNQVLNIPQHWVEANFSPENSYGSYPYPFAKASKPKGFTSIEGRFNVETFKYGASNFNLPERNPQTDSSVHNIALTYELHTSQNSAYNIHAGRDTRWSDGCVVIGSSYVWNVFPAGSIYPKEISGNTYVAPGFDYQNSINTQYDLFKKLACAKIISKCPIMFKASSIPASTAPMPVPIPSINDQQKGRDNRTPLAIPLNPDGLSPGEIGGGVPVDNAILPWSPNPAQGFRWFWQR